ncbi:MAG: hypothetical protein ABI716_01695 [Candidatus Saccharibacteria bacterium]
MVSLPQIQKDLIDVSWALNIFRLGTGIVGIFIPLVILKSGGELWQIASFYLLYAFVKLCINYPSMLVVQKKGAFFGLGSGFLFGILQLVSVLLYATYGNLAFLGLAAISLSFTNAFLWYSQHFFISQVIDGESRSSNIAYIEIIGKVFDVIGPILGGLIGVFFGTSWLLVSAIVCILATAIPLRHMSRAQLLDRSISLPPVKYNLSGAPARDLVANFCFNVETSIGVLFWPIYLAVILNSYQSVGAIAAVSATASILTAWVAGKRGDSGGDRSVMHQGVAIISAVNIFRIFASTTLLIGFVSAAYRSSLSYFQNAWTSTYYGHAQVKGSQYIVSMEIACDLAYVTMWGTLLGVLVISPNPTIFFNAAFLIGAFAVWGCLLITRQDRPQKLASL